MISISDDYFFIIRLKYQLVFSIGGNQTPNFLFHDNIA